MFEGPLRYSLSRCSIAKGTPDNRTGDQASGSLAGRRATHLAVPH
jgi:hypothetical protein